MGKWYLYILYRLTDILRRILFRVNFTVNNFIWRFLYLGYICTGILFKQVILRAITGMERLGYVFLLHRQASITQS